MPGVYVDLHAIAVVLELEVPEFAGRHAVGERRLARRDVRRRERSGWRLFRRGTTTPLRNVASTVSGARVIARGRRGGFGMLHQSTAAVRVESPPPQ